VPQSRAIGSAGERLVHTEEVTGSIPVSPTTRLGARPHAPRELYRAYLAQSDVFVGIYWQQYGWVAPGEQVSGLEDEYLLSGGKPKLIYVKAAETREPRPARRDGHLAGQAVHDRCL
jgi:Domain of unknown function (DUF4062)